MTENIKSKLSAGQVIFSLCALASLALAFIFSEVLLESMKRGMKLCISSVIPSLFPFAVLSELTVRSGTADGIARLLGGAFERLFGVRREGAIALILGIICGFPIGTRSALSLYERGSLSRDELERLLCFCNGPSPAFLIGGIGTSLFGSRELGILLFAAELISCFAVGILLRWLFCAKGERERAENQARSRARASIPEQITLAVSESARSMILVCAFIIFFCAFGGVLGELLVSFGAPRCVEAMLMGTLELTSGALSASRLQSPLSCLLAAACVGWSGLSVHFQFISICGEHKIRLGRYFCSKLCRAAIDAAVVAVGMKLFGTRISFCEGTAESFLQSGRPSALGALSLLLFAIGALSLWRRESEKINL